MRVLRAHSEPNPEVCVQVWVQSIASLGHTWVVRNMEEYEKQAFRQMVEETSLSGIEKA